MLCQAYAFLPDSTNQEGTAWRAFIASLRAARSCSSVQPLRTWLASPYIWGAGKKRLTSPRRARAGKPPVLGTAGYYRDDGQGLQPHPPGEPRTIVVWRAIAVA